MGKLISHWGESTQHGKTYYAQKIMHHLFGIVDSSNMRNVVYVTDETVAGDKDADHMCSFLFDYTNNYVHSNARYIRIFLESAPYFKNRFLV